MTFYYTKITEVAYLDGSDEYEYDGEDFEYEVDSEQIAKEVAELVNRDYFKCGDNSKAIELFISDCDILEEVAEMYYDELREIFREEAMESYE